MASAPSLGVCRTWVWTSECKITWVGYGSYFRFLAAQESLRQRLRVSVHPYRLPSRSVVGEDSVRKFFSGHVDT
jgi:hypothetical protein